LNLLSELGENTIVILSTHIVEDVKELCSDMAIINRGQVLYKGNPFDAMAQLEGKVWQKRITKAELNTYKEHFTVISDRLIAGTPVINVLADTQPEAGFVAVNPDLEDVYFGKIFANA
jgi:ABC-type multidrug transport system ATPase subunit